AFSVTQIQPPIPARLPNKVSLVVHGHDTGANGISSTQAGAYGRTASRAVTGEAVTRLAIGCVSYQRRSAATGLNIGNLNNITVGTVADQHNIFCSQPTLG